MVSRRSESVEALIIRALDAWNRIQYYHQLLEFECSEHSESMVLLADCYMTLSEPHREELNSALSALKKQLNKSS